MSENEENGVNTSTQENEQKSSNSSFGQKISNAAQNVAKAVKKHGAKQTLLLPLAKILVIVFLIILIIVIITGIFMFLVTMPGMVMDKLSAAFEEAGKFLAAAFGADTTKMIESEQIFETLDYIEEMGWDLKGEGFLTDYIESESDVAAVNSDIKANLDEGYYIDDTQGVARSNDDGSVVLAESDFIFTYIMSDNYIYTIKNENLVMMNQPGFLGWIEGILNTLAYKALRAIYGPLLDIWGVTDGMVDTFGKGMLAIYREDGGNFGTKGNVVNFDSFGDDAEIEVDTSAKKLIVKRNRSLFKNGFTLEYSLDGWTGRYGMPLEFLLAIHKATLKPDLAYDMATTFNTNVNLILHDITGEVTTGYKTADSIVSYQQIARSTNTFPQSDNLWEDLVNWLDEHAWDDKEIEAMYKLGVDIIDDCPNCTTKIVYILYDQGEPHGDDYGEFLVRVPYEPGDKVYEDSEEGDFLNADFYYTQDDNEYDGGFWNWLLGENDNDDKGNGEYAIGDENLNGEIDGPTKFLVLNEGEVKCDACYCKLDDMDPDDLDDSDGYCSGCGDGGSPDKNGDGYQDSWWAPCKCDFDKEKAEYEGEQWKKYEGNKERINRYKTIIDVCSDCETKAKNIASTLQRNEYDFRAYQPYIYSVTDHWYRDVYFVEPTEADKRDEDSSIDLVDQDYDYESLMRERWTLYETHEDGALKGNFKWYIVGKDGKFITSDAESARVETEGKKEIEQDKVKSGTDGYLYYNVATTEEADEVGLAVAKKAITLELDDEVFEDLGWNQTNGKWTAYKVKSANQTTQTGYYPLSEMYESTDAYHSDIGAANVSFADKIYVNMATKYNVIQTGEGLRTETNPEIKKMFLQNKYYQYDGSVDTAEIITALREKRTGDKYGALTEEEYESTVDLTIDGETKSYRVKDYAGTVTLDQDSLNAFTMLENTHTLDSDYIYRDFKELVVELGYFTKEQVTEEIPEVLEFPVPEIGSAGYPDRTIDKVDNEFGTMIHSKYDIKANRKYTLAKISNEGLGDLSSSPVADQEENVSGIIAQTANANPVSGVGSQLSAIGVNIETTVGDATGKVQRPDGEEVEHSEGDYYEESEPGYYLPSNEETNVDGELGESFANTEYELNEDFFKFNGSAIGDVPLSLDECKKPSQVTLDEFFRKTREMCEYMNMVGYDYCVSCEPGTSDYRGACTCDIHCKEIYALIGVCYKQLNDPTHKCDCPSNHCKHNIHGNPHGLAATFEGSKADNSNNVCCDQLVKWALQNVKIAPVSVGSIFAFLDGLVADGEAEKFGQGVPIEEGDILFSSGHIEIVGEEKGEGFVQYNGGHQVEIGATEGSAFSAIGHKTEAESWSWATGLYRLKWAESVETGPYEGYEGNEEVVSPVTGVLLEYGTTKRINLDQKYKSMYEDDVEGEATETTTEMTVEGTEDGKTEAITGKIVEEEVGYARILVLNEEYYTALEEKVSSQYTLNMEPVETNKELSNLLKSANGYLSETMQAYKKYKDLYEYSGVGGYIITIEGFKTQLPDPNFDSDEDEHFDDETTLPYGGDSEQNKLTMDDFKVPLNKIEDPGDKIQSKYEEPDAYKMNSESATEKMEVEETMRKDAAYAMLVGEAIFIKEGTVLGRTFTDREMVLSVRGEELTDYMCEATINGEEPDPEEDTNKVIGNYIRVIMENGTDEEGKKTYVEDVEDYMKLDELERLEFPWELFFWLPFESGACDDEFNGGPECIGVCSPGETAVGIIQWTSLGDMNNIADFCKKCVQKEPSLCAPLNQFTDWTVDQFTQDIGTGPSSINYETSKVKAALNQICEADREAFLALQMEIAKEEYLEPLLEDYPWLELRPLCVQGAVMHLSVWGADTTWLNNGWESATDEEIVLKVRNVIANTGSTVGPASGDENSGRAYNEPQIALEILAGRANEDDIEKWIREKDASVFDFDFK